MASETGTGRHAQKGSKEPSEHQQTQSAQSPQGQNTMNTQGSSQGESRSSSAKSTSAKSEQSSSHAQHAPGNGELKGREHRDKQGNIHHAPAASQHGSSSGPGESGHEPVRKAS
jgi:hypothetical protein